jgi:CHAT domain-containing protein
VVVAHGCILQGANTEENELALVLSDGNGGWSYLSSTDLAQWPLQGSALYMVACWAGSPVGKVVGDMRQAATLSGVRYLVAPLWKVPEQAAYDFLSLLLEEQQKGQSPAAALDAAQMRMRKKPVYEHPYYWAGYTVSGAGAAELQ